LLLSTACDVASAVASTCTRLAPDSPTVAQYSSQVSQAAHDLVGSWFDNGPVAWLGLVIVLLVFKSAGGFLIRLIARPERTDRT
jgi:hypothetical protein